MHNSRRSLPALVVFAALVCGCLIDNDKGALASEEIAVNTPLLLGTAAKSQGKALANRSGGTDVVAVWDEEALSVKAAAHAPGPRDVRWEIAARPLLANQPRFQHGFLLSVESRF
jgi:hypothetical protein